MKTVILDVRAPADSMADFVRVWKTGKLEKMGNRIEVRHKSTDSKGRVTLGGHFANRAVIAARASRDLVTAARQQLASAAASACRSFPTCRR